MTVSVVGTPSFASIQDVTLTITLPSGIASGDYIILLVGCGEDAGPPAISTPPSGYTPLGSLGYFDYGAGALNTHVYYKLAGSSESNPSITWTQGSASGGGLWSLATAWRSTDGWHGTSPITLLAGSYDTGSSSSPQPPDFTLSNVGHVVHFLQTSDNNNSTLGTANGFTLHGGGNSTAGSDGSIHVAGQAYSSTGTKSHPIWSLDLGPDYYSWRTILLREATATVYTNTVSDTLDVADAVSRVLRSFRLTSDTLAVLDDFIVAGMSVTYTQTVSDAVASVIDGNFQRIRTILASDLPPTLYDGNPYKSVLATMSDESATPSDGSAFVRDWNASISDASITPSDSGWAVREWLVTVDDVGTVALWDEETHSIEAGGGDVIYTKDAPDYITTTDSLLYYRRLNRIVADSFTLTDANLAARWLTVLRDDSLALADAILSGVTRVRLVEDALSLSDQALASKAREIVSSDILSVSDGTLYAALRGRLTSDDLALSDQLLAVKLRAILSSDALNVSDAKDSVTIRGRLAQDTIGLTDALVKYLWHGRQIDDALDVVDSLLYTLISSGAFYVKTSSDSLEVLDELARVVWSIRIQGDTLEVSEATVRGVTRSRTYDENITLLDALAASAIRGRTATDTIDVVDNTVLGTIRTRLTTDLLNAQDDVTKYRVLNRALSDAIEALLDDFAYNVIRDVVVTKLVDDGLLVTDANSYALRLLRRLDDPLDVTDGFLSDKGALIRTVSDAITLADALSSYRAHGRVADDLIGLSDNAARFLLRLARATDTITLEDGYLQFSLRARDVLDVLDVTDSITWTYTSGLVNLIDVRIRIGLSIPAMELSVDHFARIGVDIPQIQLGAYN